jgi:hypothetical protein
MPSRAHEDIRRLLKEFGLTADETITAYMVETKPSRPLRLRITLEDITDYEHSVLDDATVQETHDNPRSVLRVEIEGEVGP